MADTAKITDNVHVPQDQEEKERLEEERQERIALEYLGQRKTKMLEIFRTGQELDEAKAVEKRLKKEKQKKNKELKELEDNRNAILRLAKLPTEEEEERNRAHYPIQTFFKLLNLADDESCSLSKKYNGLHHIKKVCDLFLDSAQVSHGKDGTRTILVVDVDQFRQKLDECYLEQKARKDEAEALLKTTWDSIVSADDALQAVIKRREQDVERTARLQGDRRRNVSTVG